MLGGGGDARLNLPEFQGLILLNLPDFAMQKPIFTLILPSSESWGDVVSLSIMSGQMNNNNSKTFEEEEPMS